MLTVVFSKSTTDPNKHNRRYCGKALKSHAARTKREEKKVSTVVTLKGLGCWILGWVLEGRATLLDERAPVERGDHSPWPVARGSISRFDSIKAFMDFQSRRYSGDGFWPSGEKNRPVLGVTVQGNRGSKK